MSTKFLTIIALCILGATLIKAGEGMTKEEAIKMFMEASQECQTEVGASADDLDALLKKKPASTMPGKCLHSCLMKRFKVMDGNGKFVQSVAMEHSKMWTNNDAGLMKIAQEVTDTCLAVTLPDDHCEAAATLCQCLIKESVARGVKEADF